MALLQLFLFLLALNIHAAVAADIGGACSGSDACSDQTIMACDVTCKIKAGQNCASHTDKCVANSICPTTGTKVCTCNDGYEATTSPGSCTAIAAKKVGGACTEGTCVGNNVECPANGGRFCKCKDGFTGTIGAAGCDTAIPANKVGGSCTGDTCEGNNVECPTSGSKYCRCKVGYTAAIGATGCDTQISGNKVGGMCTDNTCEGNSVGCPTSVVMANRIGGSCVTSSCGANAECSSSGVCTCVNGFTGQAGDIACSHSGGAAHSVATWFLASITSIIVCML